MLAAASGNADVDPPLGCLLAGCINFDQFNRFEGRVSRPGVKLLVRKSSYC